MKYQMTPNDLHECVENRYLTFARVVSSDHPYGDDYSGVCAGERDCLHQLIAIACMTPAFDGSGVIRAALSLGKGTRPPSTHRIERPLPRRLHVGLHCFGRSQPCLACREKAERISTGGKRP
jgi:hypothetical protein